MSNTPALEAFLRRIAEQADDISFDETMAIIDACYKHQPCPFSVGEQNNALGQNNGSNKILAFARLHQLNEATTLQLFGDFYRKDVLEHPEGTDHANIRQFQAKGWGGVHFEADSLIPMP